MKRTLLVATFFLLFTSAAVAQSNYVPGYYLTLKGDTVRGFVNYKEWSFNPESVEFKNSLQAKDNQRFTPLSINGFGINKGDTFLSFTGSVTEDEIGTTNGRDTTSTMKSVS